MFSEILRRVIFLEIFLFITLIINVLLFVFTQSFISIVCLVLNIFIMAYGFAILYIEYQRR